MMKEIEEYIEYLKIHNYSKITIKKRITGLNRLYDFLKEKNISDFNDIKISNIEGFRKYYKEKGYSNSTIKLNLKAFRAFIKYLYQKNIISINPFNELNEKEFSYNDYPEDLKLYYDLYLKTKRLDNTANSTLGNIKRTLKLFFKYLVENNILKIKDITKDDLKSFVEYLIDLKDNNGNKLYKSDSINRNIGRIKSFLLWLSDRGIKKGIISGLVFLRHSESITRNILTRKELSKLFLVEVESLYEFMIKVIFISLYSTGLRINELLKVNINDIDYESRIILAYDSKEKKDRYIHIGEVALNYIKIFIEYVREKIGYDSYKSNKLFISNYEGKPLRETTVNKYLKEFSKKAGIKKKISSHCFRHSYGSHLLENGADLNIISDLLGHSKLSTTERYTRLSPENLREVIENHHPREGDNIKWN